jgi:hypothetical protein
MITIQQASPLAHGFWSLYLLNGCAVCTEYVEFSFYLPLSYCPHKLHAYLRLEIWCVYKLTELLCYWNAVYVRWTILYYSFIAALYIWVTLYMGVEKKKSNTSLYTASTYRQRNRFYNIAVCVFAYMNIGMAAYRFWVCICEFWSFKG